jgi:hypothetical protein
MGIPDFMFAFDYVLSAAYLLENTRYAAKHLEFI